MSAPILSVFVHAPMESRALGRMLEDGMPNVRVNVYGRGRDFRWSIRRGADAALAITPVLDELGLHPVLQGARDGSFSEPYVLLSSDGRTPAEVRRLGVIEFLSRRTMGEFVEGLLGGHLPELQRVTKLVDLVALLRFRAADAVLVSKHWVSFLEQGTKLELKMTPLPSGSVGLPAVSSLSHAGHVTIVPRIQELSAAVNDLLGVQSWQ